MDQEDLFKSYIDICNRALEKNKDRFPFNCILNGIKNIGKATPVRVKIIDDTCQPQFHLQLKDGEIHYDITNCQNICQSCHVGCGAGKNLWSVKASYLEDVVQNPMEYIENPAKLDWEWVNATH